jgi:hypothetical protein
MGTYVCTVRPLWLAIFEASTLFHLWLTVDYFTCRVVILPNDYRFMKRQGDKHAYFKVLPTKFNCCGRSN